MKNNSTLPVFFCIPDLSGFTKFVTSADSEFVQLVIPDLLKEIIAANSLNMKIAEVEGDAVFFYRTGRLPAINKVAQQCKLIYESFNNKIKSYQSTHPLEYQMYLADEQLGIKIIIHYGKISLTKIDKRVKLLGEDVILAHKLLKNSIVDANYILLTDNYILKLRDKKTVKNWFNWEKLKRGSEEYEHFGTTQYSYISLIDCNNFKMKKSQLLRNSLHIVPSLP